MNRDEPDQDIIELGSVSACTLGLPYGIDEHTGGLFVNAAGLAAD